MLRFLLVVAAALVLGACTFGNQTDYQNQTPVFQAATGNAVALATHDQRPYVLSGKNSATYTGVTRSVLGVPYGVHTQSGQPLADDFSTSIASGLVERNIQVTVVSIPAKDSREQAIKALLDQGKPRALLMSIDEWETDQLVNMSVKFAIRADVFDSSGAELATNDGVAYGVVQDPMKDAGYFSIKNPATVGAEKGIHHRPTSPAAPAQRPEDRCGSTIAPQPRLALRPPAVALAGG